MSSTPTAGCGRTALNSLLLDRIDHDRDRLEAINDLMEAGERRFGSAFPHAINDELAQSGRVHRIRRVRTALIRATKDIGGLAAEFVRSASFANRRIRRAAHRARPRRCSRAPRRALRAVR
ncbi:MAG TPA: hypothetical protein VHB97_11790 [Polyangia bacterium]|nr:hypothetical protein [Polyangia bacterium]